MYAWVISKTGVAGLGVVAKYSYSIQDAGLQVLGLGAWVFEGFRVLGF
jgi:hypothetical protein